jgi:hypothetical protein
MYSQPEMSSRSGSYFPDTQGGRENPRFEAFTVKI